MPRLHQLGEVARVRLADRLPTFKRAPHSILGEEIAAVFSLKGHLPHAPAVAAIVVGVRLRHPFDLRIVRELALAATLRTRRGNARFIAAGTLRTHLSQNLTQLLLLCLGELRELRLDRLQELRAQALLNHLAHAVNAVSNSTEMGADLHNVLEPGMTLRHPTLREKIGKAINLPRRDTIELSHRCSELNLSYCNRC